MKRALPALLLVSALTVSCAAQVGVGGMTTVPKDAQATCAGYCSEMGMSLGAVVLMANNAGCVCNTSKAATPEEKSASAGGGMAAILIQEEEAERSRQSSQQHH